MGAHPPPVKIKVNMASKEQQARDKMGGDAQELPRSIEGGEANEGAGRLESIQMMAKRLKNEGISKEIARQMLKAAFAE